jgi:photosystem II stability/assembly factor-like uncharacterized protein
MKLHVMLAPLWTVLAALASAPVLAAASSPAALQRPALAVANPTIANLLAVERAGQRLVAAGERGLIIYSDDSGRHWTQAKVPVSVTLTALRFADDKSGWATGNMGVILHSTDGGVSWSKVFDGLRAGTLALAAAQAAWDAVKPDPGNADHPLNLLLEDARRMVAEGADKPFLDLRVGAGGALLAVGAYGMAFASADGGGSWQAQMPQLPNPNGATWYGIVQRGAEQYLYGEQGVLLRADGAGPFLAQPSPAGGSLFGALATRGGALMLFGLRGKVYRSAAAGAPWVETQTPVDASLLSALELADGTLLLLGAAGQIVASRDQGHSFAVLPLKTRFPFTDAAPAPDGALIVAGTRGLLRLEVGELAAVAKLAPHAHP